VRPLDERTETHSVDAKLTRLLTETLKIPATAVTDELAMKDVDSWDSLKHMELIASLEETFAIQLTFDEIVAMQSVREIKQVLGQRGIAG
jgi:acyl carrier protein